jgi:hypothetical protein
MRHKRNIQFNIAAYPLGLRVGGRAYTKGQPIQNKRKVRAYRR